MKPMVEPFFRMGRTLFALIGLGAWLLGRQAMAFPYEELGKLPLPVFGGITNFGDIFGRYPHDTTLADGLLYLPIGTFGGGMVIVDVSNPLQPSLTSHFTEVSSRHVAVSGSTLYSVSGNRLDIIDASDPFYLESLGFLDLNLSSGAAATRVAVADEVAFVVGGGPFLGAFPALRAIDVSNPAMPTILDGSAESGGADVFLSGSLAYVAAYESGLRIYDVSSPSQIELVGSTGTLGTATSVEVVGNVAIVGNGGFDSSLALVDVSDPSRPVLRQTLVLPQEVGEFYVGEVLPFHGLRVSDGRAYLTTGSSIAGAIVVDVSAGFDVTPTVLEPVAFEGSASTGGIEVVGNLLLLATVDGIITVPEAQGLGWALGALLVLTRWRIRRTQ